MKLVNPIELDTVIDQDGIIHLPKEFSHLYGHEVQLRIVVTELTPSQKPMMDPMKYSHTVNWPIDGMEYQLQVRDEWD